jgi:hypothetical protein
VSRNRFRSELVTIEKLLVIEEFNLGLLLCHVRYELVFGRTPCPRSALLERNSQNSLIFSVYVALKTEVFDLKAFSLLGVFRCLLELLRAAELEKSSLLEVSGTVSDFKRCHNGLGPSFCLYDGRLNVNPIFWPVP